MKIVVIGLGSMGKRRIRLIQKLNDSFQIIGIDSKEERREEAKSKYGISVSEGLSDVIVNGADCAFICTSPLSHSELIHSCLNQGMHVFTELNLLLDGYEENINLAKQKNLTLFLSSTFLYRDETRYIMEQVHSSEKKIQYSYHIGQYLPDWHPWESYQDYFVGNKRTNGCREILAIELPWIIKAFGKIEDVKVVKNNLTDLKIDYPDSYLLIIEHECGNKGMMAVDVASRKAIRKLEVYGEELYIEWTGTPDSLKQHDILANQTKEVSLYTEIDTLDNYSSFVIENAYENEIRRFFKVLEGTEVPAYTFEEDIETLEWIDRIEQQ